ncbi:MAG: IS200/IS605 family transposase [Deltaproteobacteria bacterium]|jgi:REP element-mobilizing transposase RayT|nr:IS200/IS605 family transposase [Deltaproteobacteria bacterium]
MNNTPAKTTNNHEKIKLYNYRKPVDENNTPIKTNIFNHLNFFQIHVHVAWTTNGAKPILTREICYSLNNLIKEFTDKRSLEILNGEINRDSVYMFLNLNPKTSLETLVNKLKQFTSDGLYRMFPALSREYPDGQIWSQGYLCLSEGKLGNEVKEYFKEQTNLALQKAR